jgi:tetratricopeptide (TPR) repeat protein
MTTAAPSRADDAAAGRAAFAEGQKQFVGGDYRAALASFKNGYVLTQDPAFLLNIAQCHRSLGDKAEALMMFRLYLKSSLEGVNPGARALATKAINELESENRAAAPAPGSGVVVHPAPSGAPAESSGLTATGSAPKFQSGPGGMPVLEPAPDLDAAKAAEPTGKAQDSSGDAARTLKIAAIACGAVGLVAVGTGVYYYTRAGSLSDSANKAAVYNQADYDDGKHAEKMQWIFYGVGAAALATGVGLFVYGQLLAAPKKTNVSVAPMAAPGTAGLAAVGTF